MQLLSGYKEIQVLLFTGVMYQVSAAGLLAAGLLALEEAVAALLTALTQELVQVVIQEMAGQAGCQAVHHQLLALVGVAALAALLHSLALTQTAMVAEVVVVAV